MAESEAQLRAMLYLVAALYAHFRDRERNRALYARLGVQEYWLYDPTGDHRAGGDMSTASFGVSGAVSGDVSGTDRIGRAAKYRDEDFPGCESFHLPADELDHYEYRLEFWDGYTETAWKVCEPTSIQHEEPARLLAQLAGRFAMVRGSRIACLGSADLLRRDAMGRKRWLMQADEVLYLHPHRVRLHGPAIEVDRDRLPDVVLEVDHTTDVRRRKLGIYKGSGFPEIWVLVPWEASVRRPGLTIHLRRGDGYCEEPASRAFPGWRAEEIFRALTEAPMSEVALRALERTALAMGAREGTKPDDDPLMRSQKAIARTEGHAEGRREGLTEGGSEMLAANVLTVLKARGIAAASSLAELRELIGTPSSESIVEAALACTDPADFRRRVREQGASHGRQGPDASHRT